jgi:hypothetical protein
MAMRWQRRHRDIDAKFLVNSPQNHDRAMISFLGPSMI